jgi:hypothetical protein
VFAKLEEEASDIEERCWIRILKLRAQCKYHEFRRALERIEESLKETSWFNLTMAVEIERPQLRAEFLLKSIAIGRGAASMEARISLARTDFELGASSRAIESLSQILSAKQAGGFSEKASRTLVELCPEWHPTEKLMVYLSGLSGSVPDGYRWIYELAHASSWRVLDLYCSNKFNSFEETGTSANNLGISREAFGLKSLAYEAYSRAFSLGVAVARYNMASLVYHQGVSSAALEALRDHAGTVDSADPGYPYSLRAEIERSVHGERQREAIGLNLGEAQLKVLWALAEKVVSSPRGTGIFPSGRLACKHASITLEKGKMISGDGTPCPTLIPVRLFGDDLFVCGMGGGTAIVAVGVASAEGVFFTNFAEGTGLEWFLWTSKEDLPSTNEIETDTQGEHHFSLSEGSPPALGSSVLLG